MARDERTPIRSPGVKEPLALNPVWIAFEPGASVVIDEGILQGVRATVLGVAGKHRIVVAVTLWHGLTAVELDPCSVRVDEPAAPLSPMSVH